MAHEEYIRILPGADTAVLLIHGIVGTPDHFRSVLPLEQAIPESWSVYNMLLPGHGGSTLDFGKSSMKLWKEKVWKSFSQLAETHERIMIVGHSMGALFAMELAAEFPQQVARLFLLAVPLRPYLGVSAAVNSLRLTFGKTRPDHPKEVAIVAACGSRLTLRLWEYLRWLPRFLELFREVRVTEKCIGCIQSPCSCWQSGRDELVLPAACRVLAKSDRVEAHRIPESSHFYYAPGEREQIMQAFCECCEAMTKR